MGRSLIDVSNGAWRDAHGSSGAGHGRCQIECQMRVIEGGAKGMEFEAISKLLIWLRLSAGSSPKGRFVTNNSP